MTITIKRSWMHFFVALIWGLWACLCVGFLIAGYPYETSPMTLPLACITLVCYAIAAGIEERQKEKAMEAKKHD